ncbi:hypothetical protein MANES_01G069750v8 [Manihot esculenta]|uniref:Uncharacterized protein n=1 Tax=Manihot esculenta TaxID=3983 RepID=A0ACB7IBB7_MANES|nr:hypothetical protein MANES_01G069750v8 [Manihot esculenta]
MQDPSYKRGFKFDHVWNMMKDAEKFKDCSSKKKIVQNQSSSYVSSESDNPTPDSPMVPSPNLSSFSIHLNEDIAGDYTSSNRPLGVKKAKLKKKFDESFSSALKCLHANNEKLVESLANATAEREKGRLMKSRALDLKEFKEENKILLLDLNSISDPIAHETFRQEKIRISEKRAQRQQPPPPSASNVYGQYLNDIAGSGSDLPEY